MNSRKQNLTLKPRDPDFVGSDVAMRRAAKRARQRAKETAEIAAANKGSGQNRRDAQGVEARIGRDSLGKHRP